MKTHHWYITAGVGMWVALFLIICIGLAGLSLKLVIERNVEQGNREQNAAEVKILTNQDRIIETQNKILRRLDRLEAKPN